MLMYLSKLRAALFLSFLALLLKPRSRLSSCNERQSSCLHCHWSPGCSFTGLLIGLRKDIEVVYKKEIDFEDVAGKCALLLHVRPCHSSQVGVAAKNLTLQT
eukprot:1208765-Amphidinium_carterae.2